ncbi:hypothetical protein [Longimicrobium sp.]|uniref:hypothetical protein n=1 Tax=Longimicrobium sp. TaxID=2029185 RepID=UPI002EDA87D9
MEHLSFFAMVLAAGAAFAQLEIQIEGTAGWAAALPTWRVENRWTRLFFSSRPLTGYHFYVHVFVTLVVHLPFALGFAAPTWKGEARIVAWLILFWVAEDFLWFVMNPAFGLRKFRREHIWWHAPTWVWIMPRDYWVFTPIAAALYLWSHR